jgi:hypothetical protein
MARHKDFSFSLAQDFLRRDLIAH